MKRFDRPLLGFLSKEELDSIVGAANPETFSGRRDGLLFRLLFHTGARVSEILALRRQDILWGQMTTVQLRGKGRKQRAVPLLKSMAAEVKRYLDSVPWAGEASMAGQRRRIGPDKVAGISPWAENRVVMLGSRYGFLALDLAVAAGGLSRRR